MTTEKSTKSDTDWRAELTPEQYHVLREKGTERAFTGAYWDEHRPGIYRCAACGNELFDAGTKFESGTGWPSFYQPLDASAVDEHLDGIAWSRLVRLQLQRDPGSQGRAG